MLLGKHLITQLFLLLLWLILLRALWRANNHQNSQNDQRGSYPPHSRKWLIEQHPTKQSLAEQRFARKQKPLVRTKNRKFKYAPEWRFGCLPTHRKEEITSCIDHHCFRGCAHIHRFDKQVDHDHVGEENHNETKAAHSKQKVLLMSIT